MLTKTFVKQTQAEEDGTIFISAYKQTFDPTGKLMSEQPHRIAIMPEDDVDMIIQTNNEHLNVMGFPSIDPKELDLPLALRKEKLNNLKTIAADGIELNSGGGVRLKFIPRATAEGELLEFKDNPQFVIIGPFDDFDEKIEAYNKKMTDKGFLAVEPNKFKTERKLRAVAHAHPLVKESMEIEAARLAEKAKQIEAAKVEADRLATEQAKAAAEAAAAEEERISAMVEKAVAARLDAKK